MPFDFSAGIAHDHLPIAGELERFDVEAGLLADLADHGCFERLSELDSAAGQRIDAMRRRFAPAHDEHAAVAENRGTDGEIRPRGISPRFGTGAGQGPIPFGYDRDDCARSLPPFSPPRDYK